MFKRLRPSRRSGANRPAPANLSIGQLLGNADLAVSIKAVNSLPENPKLRLYRALIPLRVLSEMDISPWTWKNPAGDVCVRLVAKTNSSSVRISAWYGSDPDDEYFYLDLADNAFGGIDLNFLMINDPRQPKHATDKDQCGNSTGFGKSNRNFEAEVEAMQAGLAPGQTRPGLRASGLIFAQIETFLNVVAQGALALEPLSYTSAWVFEKRGFAYTRGHKQMDQIHSAFQPGGALHQALDGSTPFRQPEQWATVRGRAWAIHDGILAEAGMDWDGIRMIKQVGQFAGVNTFPNGSY